MGPGMAGEGLEVGDRQRRRHHQVQADVGDVADRHEVLPRVVAELVEQRVDRHGEPVDEQERVAVRRSLHHGIGAEAAVDARLVLDDEGGLQLLRQLVADQARHDVRPRPRWIRNDDAHGPAGPLRRLRPPGGGPCVRQNARPSRRTCVEAQRSCEFSWKRSPADQALRPRDANTFPHCGTFVNSGEPHANAPLPANRLD